MCEEQNDKCNVCGKFIAKDWGDKKYFEHVKSLSSTEFVIEHMLDDFHMFQGDAYYRHFHKMYQEKLEKIIADWRAQ